MPKSEVSSDFSKNGSLRRKQMISSIKLDKLQIKKMSYRNLSTGLAGKTQTLPKKLSYSRYQPSGLDKNTLIEGSAIDVSSKQLHQNNNNNDKRKEKSLVTPASGQDNWKQKYAMVQKTVQNLRMELKYKVKLMSEMQAEQKLQKESHKEEKEKFQNIVENLQKEISTLKEDSAVKSNDFQKQKEDSEKTITSVQNEMKSLQMLHANTLSSMTEKHNKELVLIKRHLETQKIKLENDLKAKDDTIQNLKSKLADSFNESSKERQMQINELLKELERVSSEAEYVKNALKKLTSVKNECQKCFLYKDKFNEILKDLREKNEICQNLFSVCSKMEKQLSQQDDLLIIWKKIKNSI